MSKGWQEPRMRGRRYRRLRAQILRDNIRDNRGLCALAVPRVCTGKATQVHHTLGITVTGHDPRYLMAVCKECNLHVGDPLKQPDPPHQPLTVW